MRGPTLSAGRTLVLSACAILVGACHDSRPPSSPSPLTPTDTTGYQLSFTVSGTVFEHVASGARPLPGLRILIRTSSQARDYGNREVTSDNRGHYEFRADVGSLVAFELPAGSGYHAPCPSGVEHLAEDSTLDVHVVSDLVLKATGVPDSLPTWRPRVSGTVLATRYDGWELLDVRPIVGASVELVTHSGSGLRSETLTNARGEYLLCANPPGAGTNQVADVRVRKNGVELGSRSFTATGENDVSFELEE